MLGLHKYTKNVTINIHIKLYRKCFDSSVFVLDGGKCEKWM